MCDMSATRCVVRVPEAAASDAGVSTVLEVGDEGVWLDAADAAFEGPLLAAQAELVGIPVSSAEGTGQLGVGLLRLDPFVCTTTSVDGVRYLAVLVGAPRGEFGWDADQGDPTELLAALATHVHPAFTGAVLERSSMR